MAERKHKHYDFDVNGPAPLGLDNWDNIRTFDPRRDSPNIVAAEDDEEPAVVVFESPHKIEDDSFSLKFATPKGGSRIITFPASTVVERAAGGMFQAIVPPDLARRLDIHPYGRLKRCLS